MRQSVNQRVSASPFGGSEQAIDMLNDRWICSLELIPNSYANSQAVEAFIGAMRGQTNTCQLSHTARIAPAGTVRGTLTLSASAAQGAASIVVTGCSPSTGTLLAGDLLGAGGLLLMVASNCTAIAGVITVPITNRLRTALSSGAAVTWASPTAKFRLLATNDVTYISMKTNAVTLDFGEVIP
jgi:hypothetical protein